MNRIALSVLLAFVAAAVILEAPACKPGQAQTVINQITPAGACIAEQLLSGGAVDPLQIVAACAGVTIEDVIQVVETLLAAQPDAGVLADGGISPVAARLAAVHVAAIGIKVSRAK